MSAAIARAWVQQVARCDERTLPEWVEKGIRSSAAEAGPLLADLLGEPAIFERMAVEHVVRLLGELRVESALPDLVTLLWDEEVDGNEEAVEAFGAEAVPHLLRWVDEFPREVIRPLAACSAGSGDPRVRAAVVRALVEAPDFGAGAAARFGDRSLLPELFAALERASIPADEFPPGQTIVELLDAIQALGGDPGELGERRRAELQEARRPMIERLDALLAERGA